MKRPTANPLFIIFLLTLVAGCGAKTNEPVADHQPGSASAISQTTPATTQTPANSTFVHLFEWKWSDIALECERFLGPAGYSAVQISPPNEHLDHKSPQLAAFDYPWWARYQPVTFDLTSRSGTEEQLRDMIQRCNKAGVAVYADVVVNHMADLGDTGVAGTPFNRETRSYRDYSESDFHDVCVIQQQDYSAAENPEEHQARAERVRLCQLGNLPDLNTSSEKVRDAIAGYLQTLADIGVQGFRIDAAKHMHPEDIASIRSKLEQNQNLYFFLEVIDIGNQSVDANDYAHIGDITELKYAHNISEIFGRKPLDALKTLGNEDWYLASDNAVIFIDNHDSQRGHGTPIDFSHRQGKLYELANIFMLAWPYGYPKVMSSYQWGGVDDSKGPPHDGQGNTADVHNPDGSVNCFGESWVCEHRIPAIAAMVKFRNHMQASGVTQVTNWWSNSDDQVAFSLIPGVSDSDDIVSDGTANGQPAIGFVAINRGEQAFTAQLQTNLPAGNYCNRLDSDAGAENNSCEGDDITVDPEGIADITVPGMGAVALF